MAAGMGKYTKGMETIIKAYEFGDKDLLRYCAFSHSSKEHVTCMESLKTPAYGLCLRS